MVTGCVGGGINKDSCVSMARRGLQGGGRRGTMNGFSFTIKIVSREGGGANQL